MSTLYQDTARTRREFMRTGLYGIGLTAALPLIFRDRAKHPDRMLGKLLMIRDWAHLARYNLQGSGGQLTPTVAEYYEAALKMYREDFLGKAHSMAVDDLQYYHEALMALNRGFEVNILLQVAWLEGGTRDVAYKGRVASVDDLKQLLTGCAGDLAGIWQEKYL